MIIQSIETRRILTPLNKPFITALRTVYEAESVIVRIELDNGIIGWGEAVPTLVITGESAEAIEASINQVFKPALMGKDLLSYEKLFEVLDRTAVGNTSSKAAVDMAIYDCLAQNGRLPLYRYLGGYKSELITDFTVSVATAAEMQKDAVKYVEEGFTTLKIKVGAGSIQDDISRVEAVRKAAGPKIALRLDANQAWQPKEAIRAIRLFEDKGLEIELVEQPVHKNDIQGLKMVTDATATPIMADESVFSPLDAFEVLRTRSADLINIKLMKTGGIHKAVIINKMAETCGVECMIGSMIESRLAVTAAAHFAASQRNITRFDLDAPLMLADDRIIGGIQYKGTKMTFTDTYGLGIKGVEGMDRK